MAPYCVIGSFNGLLGLLVEVKGILSQNTIVFIHECPFQNIAYKMPAILLGPKCGKEGMLNWLRLLRLHEFYFEAGIFEFGNHTLRSDQNARH